MIPSVVENSRDITRGMTVQVLVLVLVAGVWNKEYGIWNTPVPLVGQGAWHAHR